MLGDQQYFNTCYTSSIVVLPFCIEIDIILVRSLGVFPFV